MKKINQKVLELAQKRCPENISLEEFLFPEKLPLADPFLLNGVKKACERIKEAIKKEEQITIYGDYDADGITATAILYRAISAIYSKIDTYIPERDNEGYGLNDLALAELLTRGTNLIITVDCGIKSKDLVAKYKNMGLDFIVTDHHLPGEVLPETIIVNPKVSKEEIFYDLAGAGIAYFLSLALAQDEENIKKIDADLLQLATLGTIADLVDLKMENRKIVRKGLAYLNQTNLRALKKLLESNDLSQVKSKNIAFFLGPVINSSGRMGKPELALELLTTNNHVRIDQLVTELLNLNKKRKDLVDSTYLKARKIVLEKQLFLDPFILLGNKNWQAGIIGIVAARLVEDFKRPVILLSEDQEGLWKGSGRSIANFDIFKALENNQDYLQEFGGHPQAAGLSLLEEDIIPFREALNKYVYKVLEEKDLEEKTEVDLYFENIAEIDCDFYNDLAYLEPFGQGNPEPLFSFANDLKLSMQRIGKNKDHLRITAQDQSGKIGAVYFNYKEYSQDICQGNLLFNLGINEWQNRKTLQLEVKEIIGLKGKNHKNLEEKIYSLFPAFAYIEGNNFTKYQEIKYNEVYNLLRDSKAIIYADKPIKTGQKMDIKEKDSLFYQSTNTFAQNYLSLKNFLLEERQILFTDTFLYKNIILNQTQYFLFPAGDKIDFIASSLKEINPSLEIFTYENSLEEEKEERLNRDLLSKLYLSLQRNFKDKEHQDLSDYTKLFNQEEDIILSEQELLSGIIIFEELGFLNYTLKNSFIDLVLAKNVKKNNLENSLFFRAIK